MKKSIITVLVCFVAVPGDWQQSPGRVYRHAAPP